MRHSYGESLPKEPTLPWSSSPRRPASPSAEEQAVQANPQQVGPTTAGDPAGSGSWVSHRGVDRFWVSRLRPCQRPSSVEATPWDTARPTPGQRRHTRRARGDRHATARSSTPSRAGASTATTRHVSTSRLLSSDPRGCRLAGSYLFATGALMPLTCARGREAKGLTAFRRSAQSQLVGVTGFEPPDPSVESALPSLRHTPWAIAQPDGEEATPEG